MLRDRYPYYLANQPVFANTDLNVIDKYTGSVATRVALADRSAIDQAIGLAADAVEVDTTGMGIDEVVAYVLDLLNNKVRS